MTASARAALEPLPGPQPHAQGSSCEGYMLRRMDNVIRSGRYRPPSRDFAILEVAGMFDNDPEAQAFLHNPEDRNLDDQELAIARRIHGRLHDLSRRKK